MTDPVHQPWRSAATFRADLGGAVDPAAQAPDRGSYAGIEPMGLFWSMTPTSPVGPPLPVRGTEPLRVRVAAEVDGRVMGEAGTERRLLAPGVVREVVRAHGLAGLLFRPSGAGRHPAVVTLAGSGGGLSYAEQWAALLAARGYAALALAYFRYDGLPPVLHKAPLEYFETALGWLAARSDVRADRLAVMGGSRGGELALLLGATFPRISAVVGYVPSGVLHASTGLLGEPAWSLRGQALPYLFPPGAAERRAAAEALQPVALTPWFLANLDDREAVERAMIPVERIRGPVLLLSAEDDQMWPSPALAELAVERLARQRHPYPVVHRCYPGAGHNIMLPNVPSRPNVQHPVLGKRFAFGGTVVGNGRAAGAAWREVLAFLDVWRHQ
jgi:dienelactone hydrolase